MNELALFAGAGGGILGGHLLGWRTVCAVEWEPYPASVLCARQNDGLLPPFPIWDDVQTFDGKPWKGIVDVVSGGFPCQDISAAGGGLALMENDLECGEKWRGSFTKFDPDTSLWKTHQCSLLGDLDEFSETWPQWGLMRNGECWEQQTLAQTIRGTESGFVPNGVDYFHTPNTTGLDGGSNSRKALKQRIEKWPTPLASDWKPRGPNSKQQGLAEVVKKWPTPTSSDWMSAKQNGIEFKNNRFVRTSLTTGVKFGAKLTDAINLEMKNSELDLPIKIGGKLNPTWVEWLMGWPIGWTDLKPSEMDKSHSALQQHGES
jgi:DNA (cytosine-5)-methyltransferase 1